MGPCFEKQTAIPVMVGAASFLVDVARSVGLVKGHGDCSGVSLLDATSGIGTSSMVFSMFFGKVRAGDYQPVQLEAATHNLMNVFSLSQDESVSVDADPVNVVDRKDLHKYNIVTLEPNWGKDYKKCPKGAYRMLVHKGKFDPNQWDDVCWTTRDGDQHEDTVSLESLAAGILLPEGKETKTMIVLLHVPDMYDFAYMKCQFHEKGLNMIIHDPTITHPASNLTYAFLSKFEAVKGLHPREHLINTYSPEYKHLSHYKHFHGEDRFVAVYRSR